MNKGKFAQYQTGDIIKLRRDIRDKQGVLHDGEPDQASVKVIAIRRYATFLDMVLAEGFQRVIPSALMAEAAADEYNKFYSSADQARYGVLAIEIALVSRV